MAFGTLERQFFDFLNQFGEFFNVAILSVEDVIHKTLGLAGADAGEVGEDLGEFSEGVHGGI